MPNLAASIAFGQYHFLVLGSETPTAGHAKNFSIFLSRGGPLPTWTPALTRVAKRTKQVSMLNQIHKRKKKTTQ